MKGVVQEIIGQISQDQTGEEGLMVGRKKGFEEKVKEKGERDTHRQGHDESCRVLGGVVVDAVDEEVDGLAEFVPPFKMKDKAVQAIFQEGPREQTGQRKGDA